MAKIKFRIRFKKTTIELLRRRLNSILRTIAIISK